MSISALQVKELRERTGLGMMECKAALTETNGDMEAAADLLRTRAGAKVEKKAGRIAAAGTIAQSREGLVMKLGENINVRRFERLTTDKGHIGSYVHGRKIGVLVVMDGGDEALARDIAMHVAASRPEYVSRDQVPAAAVAKEKEIFTEQAGSSGKPADIVEKMVMGRVNKYLNEITLLGQPFVKDPDTTVEKLLKSKGTVVKGFIRYEVGEGLEKRSDNFVAEVMATVKSV